MNVPVGDASDPISDGVTPCATDVDLYLHPLLEEPPVASRSDAETWAQYTDLVAQARERCSGCPLLDECMYKAVVHVDVSGYVGATTPKERRAIRRRLGVEVKREDFDVYAGARTSGKPIEAEEVLRVRAQYPDDSLEQLADRLGCSLSTVKRHLRRARRNDGDRTGTAGSDGAGADPADLDDEAGDDEAGDGEAGDGETGDGADDAAGGSPELPSMDAVFDAFEAVVERGQTRARRR